MLGHWKNFDELESNLSLDELTALLDISREQKTQDREFLAAINGVDLDPEDKEPEDILDLNNAKAASEEGFGINEGLGFIQMEV